MYFEGLIRPGVPGTTEEGPTQVERLAAFVRRTSYSDISEDARQALKIRVLDSIACAIGALDGPPIHMLRSYLDDLGGNPLVTLIGAGGAKTSPDRAALYNSALVRYLDYNDGFLSKGETCHPSDNVGAVLAASEYAGATGQEFLTALAVAYQVQCRLSEEAPGRVRDRRTPDHAHSRVPHASCHVRSLEARSLRGVVAIREHCLS